MSCAHACVSLQTLLVFCVPICLSTQAEIQDSRDVLTVPMVTLGCESLLLWGCLGSDYRKVCTLGQVDSSMEQLGDSGREAGDSLGCNEVSRSSSEVAGSSHAGHTLGTWATALGLSSLGGAAPGTTLGEVRWPAKARVASAAQQGPAAWGQSLGEDRCAAQGHRGGQARSQEP